MQKSTVYLSKHGRIFELFDKIDFRTLAGENELDKLAFALTS